MSYFVSFFSFFRFNVCFSCAATTNEFRPHYGVHGGATHTSNKINKYERNNNHNNYNDNDVGGVGCERRDQFKSARLLFHSLGAPSTLSTDAINLSDSVPNLCENSNATVYCNGLNQITVGTNMNANRSNDAVGAGRVSQVYVDAMNSASVAGDNIRSKLLWAKPPISEKSSRIFFGVSLDEREMPITRERQTKLLTVAANRDPNGRKANKSNGGGATQSVRNGNTKYDLFMDRPRNRWIFNHRFMLSSWYDFTLFANIPPGIDHRWTITWGPKCSNATEAGRYLVCSCETGKSKSNIIAPFTYMKHEYVFLVRVHKIPTDFIFDLFLKFY